jgi:alpha/beta superfamily hydrolase
VQGDADEVVETAAVTKLAERLNRKKHRVAYEIIKGAGHFFENEMDQFQTLIDAYIAEHTNHYDLVMAAD